MAILRTDEKRTNLTIAEYDGLARNGEIVVDLSDYSLWIGNATGNLVPASGNANLPEGGGRGWLLSTDGQGNYSWVRPCCIQEPFTIEATWQAGLAAANAAYYFDPDLNENVPNPKPLLVEYTLPITAEVGFIAAIKITDQDGVDTIITPVGIGFSQSSFTIGAGLIPDSVQTNTGDLTITVTLLDIDQQPLGPATTVITPTLVESVPFTVGNVPFLNVTAGTPAAFWDPSTPSTITVSGLTVVAGDLVKVVYQLRDGSDTVVDTSPDLITLNPYTFNVANPGTYTVRAIVTGTGSGGDPAETTVTLNSNPLTNPAVITTGASGYQPLLFVEGTITPPTFDPDNNPAIGKQTFQFALPGTVTTTDTRPLAAGKFFWVAIPTDKTPVKFTFTVPGFPPATLPPSQGAGGVITQTIDDSEGDPVEYTLYGFTNGAPFTLDIVTP